MAHEVDGFGLTFTHRRSWKAWRRAPGHEADIIPVTWTKGRFQAPGSSEILQEVWYSNEAESEAQRTSAVPFVVALAIAKDYAVMPHAFKEFRGLFEVVSTGERVTSHSIQTRVLRRVRHGQGMTMPTDPKA
jgi:hypothetical protein